MHRALILLGALLLASAAHAETSTSADKPVVAQSLDSFNAEAAKVRGVVGPPGDRAED